MKSFIEVMNKASDKIQFGWSQEATAGIAGYNVYVGQVPGNLSKLVSNVSPIPSNDNGPHGKVIYCASASAVQTLLSIPSTFDFSNLLLYWAITYIDSYGSESPIAGSTVVEVPPVGIYGKTAREDPTINRHPYGFSEGLQKWVKTMASSRGSIIVESNDYYKENMITDYTRDSTGNILTQKTYFGDRTTSGSPAKLITYSYSGGFVSKVVVADSTV